MARSSDSKEPDDQLLQNVLSRLVAARESLEYGDVGEAAQILYELEIDLAGCKEERRAA